MFCMLNHFTLFFNYKIKFISVAFILITLQVHGQNIPAISFNSFGEIKLGMKLSELEKLIHRTITLPNALISDNSRSEQFAFHINYQGIDEEITVKHESAEKSSILIINEIKSNSTHLKSISGIGIGDDKFKVIYTYRDNMLRIVPEYDEKDYKTRIKGKSLIEVFSSNNDNIIIFYLTDEKVTGMGLKPNEI